jgi:hypothetical protein
MRPLLPLLLLACVGTATLAQEAAPPRAAAAEPAAWITDRQAFSAMCHIEGARTFLTFASADACAEAVIASANHCDSVLTSDFGKFEGTPELQSRQAFFRGAGQGCFIAQMNGRTSGRFVELLQFLAKNAKDR